MGKIFKFLSPVLSIVGLGGGDKPKVSDAAGKDVAQMQAQGKSARASLFQTAGGVSGEELDEGQVKKRATIFGN